jgi:ABC-type phosphate transport system permease subunit
VIFFFEPSRPLAPTIIKNIEELSSPPMKHTLYAIAAVLLFSAMSLSLIGWAIKQSTRKYALPG